MHTNQEDYFLSTAIANKEKYIKNKTYSAEKFILAIILIVLLSSFSLLSLLVYISTISFK